MPKYSSNLPDMDAILNYDRQIFERNKADRGPEHAVARMGQQQMFRGVEQETGFNPENLPPQAHQPLMDYIFKSRLEKQKGQATADVEAAKNAREKQEQIETESRARTEWDRQFNLQKKGSGLEDAERTKRITDRMAFDATDLLELPTSLKHLQDAALKQAAAYDRAGIDYHYGKDESGVSQVRPGPKPTTAPQLPTAPSVPQPNLWQRMFGGGGGPPQPQQQQQQQPSPQSRQGWTIREIK